METGKENNPPAKAGTKRPTIHLHHQKETSETKTPSRVISCHLTDLSLSFCPTFGCMWSDGNGGCLHRRGIEAEDLGVDKGMSDREVQSTIRKGKSEITRFVILDSYVQFLKEALQEKSKRKLAALIREDAKIAEILRTSKTYPILQSHFSLDNFIVSQMCDEKLYSQFCQRLGIKPPNVVTLTGIREIYHGRLRDRMKELKRTLRGNDKSKRRKKRSKGKNHEQRKAATNQTA